MAGIIYYIPSDYVQVFPAGLRGMQYNKSKFTTEDNLLLFSRLSANKDNYNHCYDNPYDANQLIIKLQGYYFNVPKNVITTHASYYTNSLYAVIRLVDKGDNIGYVLANVNPSDTGLANHLDQIYILDQGTVNNYKFYGLSIVDEEALEMLKLTSFYDTEEAAAGYINQLYSLKIAENGSLLTKKLILDSVEVRDTGSDLNISEQLTSNKVRTQQVTSVDPIIPVIFDQKNIFGVNEVEIKAKIKVEGELTTGVNAPLSTEGSGHIRLSSAGSNPTTIIGPNNGTINLPANTASNNMVFIQNVGNSGWLGYSKLANASDTLVQKDGTDIKTTTLNTVYINGVNSSKGFIIKSPDNSTSEIKMTDGKIEVSGGANVAIAKSIDIDAELHVGADTQTGTVEISSSDTNTTTIIGTGNGKVLLPDSLKIIDTTYSHIWAQKYNGTGYVNSWIPVSAASGVKNAIVMTDNDGVVNATIKGEIDKATTVKQISSSSNNNYSMLFTTNNTNGNYVSIYYNSGITVNPSTKTITATNFAGTATNATNIGVTADSTDADCPLLTTTTVQAGTKYIAAKYAAESLRANLKTGELKVKILTAATSITAPAIEATTVAATTFTGALTGNASSATEFESNATVKLTGDVTGEVSTKKGWTVATTIKNSGVTAGTYGLAADATPGFGSTFNVPYINVNSKGLIESAATYTVTIPATIATSSALGLVKSSTTGTTASRDYNVQVNDNGTMKVNVPWTDKNVTQTITDSTNSDYRVLFSSTANDNTLTEGARKSSKLKFNPSTGSLYSTVLYQNNVQVVDLSSTQDLTNKTYNGYTLAAACAKGVTDSSSAGAFSSSGTNLVTERDVYYGLPKINNANNYTRSTTIYAPTAGGTSNYILIGKGTTSAPGWTQYLSVAQGGTGNTTLASGEALIGNGTSAITTRAITNNTKATAITASTNLITANTLYYHTGNANITTVGTITSGIWNGSEIGASYLPTATASAKGIMQVGTGLSVSSGTVSLAASGVTAGSYGNSSNQTPAYDGTFNVPYITVDTYGRITGISNKTVKIPASDNTNTAHSHSAGAGLTKTGDGTTSGDIEYKANLVNETVASNAASYTAGGSTKFYAVQLDKNSKLGVYVPWSDTTYSFSTNDPTLAWGKTATIGTAGGVTYKVTMPSNPNSDIKVTQTLTGTTNTSPRPLLVGMSWSDNTDPTTGFETKTDTCYATHTAYIKPATGDIYTKGKFYSNGTAVSLNGHIHAAGDITSGTLAAARLPDATTSAKGAVVIGTGLSVSSGTVSLATTAVTAGSYGPSANASPDHSDAFSVPYITVDAYGRITAAATKTITLPDIYSLPTASSSTKGGVKVGTTLSISSTVLNLATSGVTAGSYGPSSNADPGNNGTFSVPYITVDTYGRVTAATTKTITMPDAYSLPNASTTTKGGMKVGTNLTASSGTVSVVSSPTFSGTVTAAYFDTSSDARLKTNFRNLEVNKSILDLPVYKFDYIDGRAKDVIGCKAQDLQEICPELVTENEDGYLAIHESKLVFLLLDEMKKLKAEIEELKNNK